MGCPNGVLGYTVVAPVLAVRVALALVSGDPALLLGWIVVASSPSVSPWSRRGATAPGG